MTSNKTRMGIVLFGAVLVALFFQAYDSFLCESGCFLLYSSKESIVAVPEVCPIEEAASYCRNLIVRGRKEKLPLFSAQKEDFGYRRRRLSREDDMIALKRIQNEFNLNQSLQAESINTEHCQRLSQLSDACCFRSKVPITASMAALDSLSLSALENVRISTLLGEQLRLFLLERVSRVSTPTFQVTRGNQTNEFQAGSCVFSKNEFVRNQAVSVILPERSIRCLPNVLIIGAQKASTTELRNTLIRGNRERVKSVAPWKLEPHLLDSFPRKPIEMYLKHSALSPSAFSTLEVYLDKTPSYFHSPQVPLDFIDGISLVVLLKEPSERMFSGYWNACLIKYRNRANCSNEYLVQAVRDNSYLEETALVKAANVGYYAQHLSRIVKRFSAGRNRGRLWISFSDRFQTQPHEFLVRLSTFLRLSAPLKHNQEEVTSELSFNSLRATGYKKPLPSQLDFVRNTLYNDSLYELSQLLRGNWLYSHDKLEVIVDQGPLLLPQWIP